MSQIRLRDWERTGVVALFSRTDGGVSREPYATLNVGLHVGDDLTAVLTNRARLAAEAGLPERRIAYAEQVHGSRVSVVGPADVGRGSQSLDDAVPGVDALVTRDADVGVAILAADCVPILLADPVAGVVAAAHAGWRGATSGIVSSTVAAMVTQGADPTRLVAALGPAIRGCCYEVDRPVITAVENAYRRFAPGQRGALVRGRTRLHAQLDLPTLCRHELISQGVRDARILDVAVCTHCMGGQFSHRRSAGPTGRHAALIWRKGAAV